MTFLGRADLNGPGLAPLADETPPEIAHAVPAAPVKTVEVGMLPPVTGIAVEAERPVSTLPKPVEQHILPPLPEAADGQVIEMQVPAATELYVQAGAFVSPGNAAYLASRLQQRGRQSDLRHERWPADLPGSRWAVPIGGRCRCCSDAVSKRWAKMTPRLWLILPADVAPPERELPPGRKCVPERSNGLSQGRVSLPVSRLISPLVLALVALPGFAAGAQAEIMTTAKQAIIYDYDTGEVLFCKDCDQPMPPSSMSKLMTVELVFQRLKDGRLKPTDTLHVSETAWRQGQKDNESKMWVAINSDVPVDDLLKGIIVQSGGDACVVVAEALGGSESGFADMMNARAKELGLTHSHFANSSGLPDPGQYMSAEDLAKLSA